MFSLTPFCVRPQKQKLLFSNIHCSFYFVHFIKVLSTFMFESFCRRNNSWNFSNLMKNINLYIQEAQWTQVGQTQIDRSRIQRCKIQLVAWILRTTQPASVQRIASFSVTHPMSFPFSSHPTISGKPLNNKPAQAPTPTWPTIFLTSHHNTLLTSTEFNSVTQV